MWLFSQAIYNMPACFLKTRRLCPSSLCRWVIYNKTESWEAVHCLCYDLLLRSNKSVFWLLLNRVLTDAKLISICYLEASHGFCGYRRRGGYSRTWLTVDDLNVCPPKVPRVFPLGMTVSPMRLPTGLKLEPGQHH